MYFYILLVEVRLDLVFEINLWSIVVIVVVVFIVELSSLLIMEYWVGMWVFNIVEYIVWVYFSWN